MDYGIAVRNKFELFLEDEDADPLEILRLQEEENSKKKKIEESTSKSQKDSKSAKNKKNKAQSAVQDQNTKPVESKDLKRDDKPQRKPRNDDRPNRPPRDRDLPPRRQQQDRPPREGGFGQVSPPTGEYRERTEGGRGRGRGRGGPRGGGRGRGGYDRFGKREFERHSGSDKTGIKATDKREGGGAHNWGTVKDDMEDQLEATPAPETNAEWTAPAEDAENQQPENAAENAEENAQPEEDQTPTEMTLDEWKALQNKSKQTSSFNVRKAGEGCDDKQWKKTYALKKKVNDDDDEESEEDDEDYEIEQRKKNYVNIEITFGDSRRGGSRGGGRGRGGRGGPGGSGRGGRGGRGGPNAGSNRGNNNPGARNREQAPNVEDEFDFPSLGKA